MDRIVVIGTGTMADGIGAGFFADPGADGVAPCAHLRALQQRAPGLNQKLLFDEPEFRNLESIGPGWWAAKFS